MYKVLPLLLLLAMGGVVTYAITANSANFSFLGFASVQTEYRIFPPPPPRKSPTPIVSPYLTGPPIATVYPIAPTPTPSRNPGKPEARWVRCIKDGKECPTDGRVCCGACVRKDGKRTCESPEQNLCIDKGNLCHTWGKRCCGGSCVNKGLGFGYCH